MKPFNPYINYDLVIVGAGPAGLSAAICASTDGLKTLLISPDLGGQAQFSTRIDNFFGFPGGIPGADLRDRAVAQAASFGVYHLSDVVENIGETGNGFWVDAANETGIHTRAILIACGLSWIKETAFLGCDRVQYGGTSSHCTGKKVVAIVGGGNAAGQAAVGFAKLVENVYLISRDPLTHLMSDYLIRRIAEADNIEVFEPVKHISIVESHGPIVPPRVVLRVELPSHNEHVPVDGIFPFLGGHPQTDWLGTFVDRSSDGFVRVHAENGGQHATSRPGIFVAGDVREHAERAVSAAVGDGRCAVNEIDRWLKQSH